VRILTADNIGFEMTHFPESVDDLRFCVLDNSNPRDPDYFFIPLVFLETFNDPALVLNIAGQRIRMPYNWQILIGEPDYGDLEVIPLTSINDREFKAFTFNPLSDCKPDYNRIDIVDVYHDVKWYFPKLKPGQLLAIPLNNDPKSSCVYFVKEISRQCEIVDISRAW